MTRPVSTELTRIFLLSVVVVTPCCFAPAQASAGSCDWYGPYLVLTEDPEDNYSYERFICFYGFDPNIHDPDYWPITTPLGQPINYEVILAIRDLRDNSIHFQYTSEHQQDLNFMHEVIINPVLQGSVRLSNPNSHYDCYARCLNRTAGRLSHWAIIQYALEQSLVAASDVNDADIVLHGSGFMGLSSNHCSYNVQITDPTVFYSGKYGVYGRYLTTITPINVIYDGTPPSLGFMKFPE